jgi:hypothetical protein
MEAKSLTMQPYFRVSLWLSVLSVIPNACEEG